MKLRVAFWPILIVLGLPGSMSLYWEPGAQSYPTEQECAARLAPLEKEARADEGFLATLRELNGGEVPAVSFSFECIDKPPREYLEDMRRQSGPGERS